MGDQTPRLTSGLCPVDQRDETRSSFLAADQCTGAFDPISSFHARRVREFPGLWKSKARGHAWGAPLRPALVQPGLAAQSRPAVSAPSACGVSGFWLQQMGYKP